MADVQWTWTLSDLWEDRRLKNLEVNTVRSAYGVYPWTVDTTTQKKLQNWGDIMVSMRTWWLQDSKTAWQCLPQP
jgi:hypothetical protein